MVFPNNNDLISKAKSLVSDLSPTIKSSTSSSLQYMSLRISQAVEALVGEDMKIYGPLEPGNIVYLPVKNAQILIEENFAFPIEY